MASLNLSTNGPSISKSYQSVVNATLPTGSGASPTYGHWAVFSVSTPLVNAFQPDAGNKESVLKVQSSGEGELDDLIEEFSEGRVQFAYVKVTDPNTGLPKNVLIAWCGDGVPERTKGYFTSHLATVSKFLHGYHVQVTGRADGDLTPAGIVQRVADSSGAKYSSSEPQNPVASSASTGSRPPVASKPVFTPSRSRGIVPTPSARAVPSASSTKVDDDGWGEDAPPVTRTQLEKVQPAYQPTRVNLQQLKSENQVPTRQMPAPAPQEREDVVKGGYQPIGKVDIAAIRKQAAESGQLKDDRPAPVKGSYEPIGKVDIAAIRARAQKPEESAEVAPPPPANVSSSVTRNEPSMSSERTIPVSTAGRLTDLPKPKVANKFGSGPAFPGTKPPLPVGLGSSSANAPVQVGAASRTFADKDGKTPAQLWAERKARERGEAAPAAKPSPQPLQSQTSGQGEWKSSYTGKSWAAVKTVQDTPVSQAADVSSSEPATQEPEPSPAPHVQDIRSQFAQDSAPSVPQANRPVPLPGLTAQPSEPEREVEHEPEAHQDEPAAFPYSPYSPAIRESSPIRVAMPVSNSGVADAHEEQQSPPPAMPIRSLQEAIPDERELEDDTHHDLGRAAAEAVADTSAPGQGAPDIRAIVQFDYEKAEDNEVELREGEQVTDIEMVDQDWWLGVNSRGERGLFPANYVEVIEGDEPDQAQVAHSTSQYAHEPEDAQEPEPEPASAPVPVPAPASTAASSDHPTATALYDYEAAEDNELSFPEGAKITNVEFPDDDWWLGEYKGARGLFPANYVELNQ
ncbi:hypothetical protein N7539_004454 [Penicillium diatomitis]|uniref:Actin binding protein n=1 Tax=Penicillium diatomitis TaxID=2819901 RepID=A0A9W9XDU9_9EURO|nr:uncharacterized protein N7539_004454 [Penicillium diatomitis]KAJ5489564.1 hypothetical protein N7539_004454 [Penicillium diatomitis]